MILFHDVDGCLNGKDGKALGFSVDALSKDHKRELSELGALLDSSNVEHFVLNTGRSWGTTEYLCRAIDSTKARYALVEHGAALWDVQTRTAVDLRHMAKHSNLEHVVAALESLNRVRELISWYQSEGDRQLADSVGYNSVLPREVDQTANLTLEIPQDLDGELVMAALEEFISSEPLFRRDSFVYHHSRPEGFIDVIGQMDKGLGVEVTIEYLGGDPAKTTAVGNGINDLSMLRKVTVPVCPANAEKPVRDICARKGVVSPHSFIGAIKDLLVSGVLRQA